MSLFKRSLQNSLGLLSADDIFISYTRRDASTYAAGLADELTKKGFSCFIDKLGTDPNKDLPDTLKNKIRQCKMLVVVGTEWAGTRETIEDEIKEYRKAKQTNIVPIKFDETIYNARWYHLIEGIAPEFENNANALTDGNPSSSVISRIEKQFNYTRRNERLRRITIYTAIILGVLVISSIVAAGFATQQVKKASAAAAESERLEKNRVGIAKRLYSTQGMIQVGSYPKSIAFDGSDLWVTNNVDNNVQAVDPISGVAGKIIPVGNSPGSILFFNKQLWVANYSDSTIQAIDLELAKVVKTIKVDAGPIELIVDGKQLWVLNQDEETVQSIDPVSSRIITQTKVGDVPTAIAFDGKNIWVTNSNEGNIQEINSITGKIARSIDLNSNPHFLAFDGELLWTVDKVFGHIKAINPRKGSIVKTFELGEDDEITAFNMWEKNLWITRNDNSICEINAGTGKVTNRVPVGSNPRAILNTDMRVWVANAGDNTIKALSPLAARLSKLARIEPGHLRFGNSHLWVVGDKGIYKIDSSNLTRSSSIIHNIASAFSTFDGKLIWLANDQGKVQAVDPESQKIIYSIDIESQPGDMTFDGKQVWITRLKDNSILPINAKTGEKGKPYNFDDHISSIAFDGKRLWISGLNRRVLAVDPTTRAVSLSINAGVNQKMMCFDGTRLWIASGYGTGIVVKNTLEAFDLKSGALLKKFDVNQTISALAFDGQRLWVAESGRNTIRPLKVTSFEVGPRINVGPHLKEMVFDGKRLWISYDKALQSIKIYD